MKISAISPPQGRPTVASVSPNAATSISVSKHKNLGVNYSANANGVFPVEITWKAPAEIASLSGYHVYRSTKPNSGFRKITENYRRICKEN